MNTTLRIGTRDSELAIWQATLVKDMLAEKGYPSTLVFIKSEGDIDLETPLYEMGVQGIFTKSLDAALLNNTIDIAVHSMKDVPTHLPAGISQVAVLKRGNYKDVFVINPSVKATALLHNDARYPEFYKSVNSSDAHVVDALVRSEFTIASSSVRRRAQWLQRYPHHTLENLRGNMNTRLKKIEESQWAGAVMAAAGLERINRKPADAVELDWMLPAPSQGAIMVVCRTLDSYSSGACAPLNHEETALCTGIEKEFLRTLMGGCTTPVAALAQIHKGDIHFIGNILSVDGKQKVEIEKYVAKDKSAGFGQKIANDLLNNGGKEIADEINRKK